MNLQKIKSLDQFLDKSEEFESKIKKLFEGKRDDLELEQFIAELTQWIQEIAEHGYYIPFGSADRRAFRSLIDRWSSRLQRLGITIAEFPRLAEFDPKAGIPLDIECPYPGLDHYTENQSGSFFGREDLVLSCVEHLEKPGNRILMIIGASGAGKSSLAMAGILAQLIKKYPSTWLFSGRMTPGANPLASFAELVAMAIGEPDRATEIKSRLVEKPDKAHSRLAELCSNKPLFLFIDQFEELLTLCRNADEQSIFAKLLFVLSDPATSNNGFFCKVLLTLRTDHLARFESNKNLEPLHSRLVGQKSGKNDGSSNFAYLSAIGFQEIKSAIKNPADKVGLRFIPESIIDQLASQTAGLSNGLPLLQFSLRRLWKNRPIDEDTKKLLDLVTQKMVQDLPDVARSLGKAADELFEKFTEEQKNISDRLMLELMVLDENFEEPLRRRRSEEELKIVLDKPSHSPEDVDTVIKKFVDEGLLRRFGDEQNRQLEVSHEALLRHWEHIYQILTGAEVKERLHLVKQIGRESNHWASKNKSKDLLKLKGEYLIRALKYAEDGWIVEPEASAYLESCRIQEEAERRKEEFAKKAEHRALRFRNIMYATSFFALIVLALFAVYYFKIAADEMEQLAQANDNIGYGFYYFYVADDPETAEVKFDKADSLGERKLLLPKVALGLISLRKEKYENAAKRFNEVIELAKKEGPSEDPVIYTYYYYLGQSWLGKNEHNEATKAFNNAIKYMNQLRPQDKNLGEYYFKLGVSYLNNDKIEIDKNYNEAEEAFKKGIDKKGQWEAINRDGLGQVYLKTSNFKAARSQFEEAIKKDEDNPNYHLNLGQANLHLNDLEGAEKNFLYALKLEKGHRAPAHDGLGQVYLKQNKPVDAHTEFKKAIEISNAPDLPGYRLNLAIVSLNLQEYGEAEKACRDALSDKNLKVEDKGKAYALLGNALLAQEKIEDAINAYEDAEKISPEDAFLALYLAEAYQKNQNHEEAEKYKNKAESLAKGDPQFKQEGAKEFFNEKMNLLKNKLNRL